MPEPKRAYLLFVAANPIWRRESLPLGLLQKRIVGAALAPMRVTTPQRFVLQREIGVGDASYRLLKSLKEVCDPY